MTDTVQTAVVGVTGYAGAELARLLLHHPRLNGKPPVFAGRVDAEGCLRAAEFLWPRFTPSLAGPSGTAKLKQEPFSWDLLTSRGVEILFLATPHEQSREWVPEALERGIRVIDLSGAWRLTDEANRAVYAFDDDGTDLAAATQAQAVYGMPELHRAQIAGAKPHRQPRLLRHLRHPRPQAPRRRRPYRPRPRHRRRLQERRQRRGQSPHRQNPFHVCGRQSLRLWRLHPSPHRRAARADRPQRNQIIFTPHLLPIPRGILSTIYVRFREPQTRAAVAQVYHDFFAGSPMVRLYDKALPQIQYSVHTSYADIGFQLATTAAAPSSSVASITC